MEPAEDASLEPAIRWLAQSILESPVIDEMDPWVREAGLVEEMEGLKSGIEGVQDVVSAVKGRALGNESLAKHLARLKELLYDAEDAVDKLDYRRLLQQDQAGTRHDLDQTDVHHGASQADRSTENAHVPNTSGTLSDPQQTYRHGTLLVENAAAQPDPMEFFNDFPLEEEGTQHDLDQTDGASQADRSTENAHVPSTSGTLSNLQQTYGHGTLLDDISGGNDDWSQWLEGLELDLIGDTSQTDVHNGTSQADRLMENADVPTTSGTLLDPPAMDGQETQPVERSRVNAAAQGGKLRSKLWKEFEIVKFNENGAPVRAKCIHCGTELRCSTKQGTGVLNNHLKSKACLRKKRERSYPSSTTDATTNPPPDATGNLPNKKRKRDEESIRLITAKTSRWKKDDFSKIIRDITLKLHHSREDVIRVLSILGTDIAACLNHSQGATSHQRRRTTGTLQGRVYGRDLEKNKIIEFMKYESFATGATVLPVLGTAGVGKTALVQLVYNHPAVKDIFDYMLWIWVSNSFDAAELTKDMLASVSQDKHVGLCNFTKLQEILESRIKSKRVLLILDDVWDGIDDYQWNQLLAPFNSHNAGRSIMIIVTTRKPSVAKRRGTVEPIKLEALKNDDFWLLFEACAFGYVNHEENYSLRDLGQQIAQKLKGNPLAAETAGALLREHLTVAHWSSILKNEDWKSLTLSGGIMSALKLCYDQLPYHLQRCFTYCSLFPCNYEFVAEDLVRIWISQGFVKCNNSSKRLEEIGLNYLVDLVDLGFFEQLEEKSCYVMHNLMYDFARVVSRTECATIDGLECNRMFTTVRHLSIYHMEDQTGNISRSEIFEKVLRNTVTSVGKLRSLVLIGQYGSSFFQFFQTAFQKAHNLRLLHLSATPVDFRSSLRNLGDLKHLRYLKLENVDAEQGALPQVLDVDQYSGDWLASLRTLDLDNSGEPRIPPSLGRLRCLRRLKLSNMRNVREVSVPSLEELVLFEMPMLKMCFSISAEDLMSSLRVLEIQSCPVLEVFDLFQKVHNKETEQNSWLPNLKKLIIRNCPNWHVTIPLPPSATALEIQGSSSQALRIKPNSVLGEPPCEITFDDKFLSFHHMRVLKYLQIKECCNLVSILSRTFGHLISLKSLKIKNCKELVSVDEDLIPSNDGALRSLESLSISKCGITGKWLSVVLRLSPALKKLYLDDCPQLTQLQIEEDNKNIQPNLTSALGSLTSSAHDGLCRIPLNLTSSFREIKIWGCSNLTFGGSRKGLSGFTCLEKLTIWRCPKLLTSLVHNDVQANRRWLLPQSLEELIIGEYYLETLWPCFVGNQTNLKKFEVTSSQCLKSLQLESCTEIGYLRICKCSSLAALEGLGSLVNLRELNVVNTPVFDSLATSAEGYKQIESITTSDIYDLSFLESLHINKLSLLTSAFCKGLTSLRRLTFQYLEEPRLTDDQEKALLLHGSLQELVFFRSWKLLHLPAVLGLPSLKTLKINDCDGISKLPKEDLPPSLEELEIESCSSELSAQCRMLATGRLRVKIDGHYV